MFRIKPHTSQRHSQGPNKPCGHQDPENPERLRQTCLWASRVYGSAVGYHRERGCVQQTWVWHKLSWRRSPLTPSELTHDWGNKLLEGTNRTLCAPGSRRKEQWFHNHWVGETDPDLPVSVQESLAEAWVGGGLLQGRGHWVQKCMHRTFWRRSIIFITSIIVWPQIK